MACGAPGAAGAAIVLGADDTLERRCRRKITAEGCYRPAVSSIKKHVIRGVDLKWVTMMLSVPVSWARRGWSAEKRDHRRQKTSVQWVRPIFTQVCRRLPGRRLALAYMKREVVLVALLR